jgi:hypothetical protein
MKWPRDELKTPLLSGRPEKRATQREMSYSEKNSLVDHLYANSPKTGWFSICQLLILKHMTRWLEESHSNSR